MINRKIGPHPEGSPPKTDLQIVEEVLMEQNSSRSSTFLASMGVSAVSKRSAVSASRIRELEERLSSQEQESLSATERYHQEMEKRMQEQERKFQEMTKKHEEELEAVKKASEENRLAFEKRHKEMDGMLSYLLRMSQSSQSQ
jgi:hypothetical protein